MPLADDGDSGVELWKAIDTIPLQTAITSGPADGSTIEDTQPTFGFDSDDPPSTFECRLYEEGASPPAFGACSDADAHTPPTPLEDGTYTFEVRATDAAGNTDPTPPARTFTVEQPVPPSDPTPPDEARDCSAEQRAFDYALASRSRAERYPAGALIALAVQIE